MSSEGLRYWGPWGERGCGENVTSQFVSAELLWSGVAKNSIDLLDVSRELG